MKEGACDTCSLINNFRRVRSGYSVPSTITRKHYEPVEHSTRSTRFETEMNGFVGRMADNAAEVLHRGERERERERGGQGVIALLLSLHSRHSHTTRRAHFPRSFLSLSQRREEERERTREWDAIDSFTPLWNEPILCTTVVTAQASSYFKIHREFMR